MKSLDVLKVSAKIGVGVGVGTAVCIATLKGTMYLCDACYNAGGKLYHKIIKKNADDSYVFGKEDKEHETELAFQIADRYISIQEVDGGYDYSIMGADYKEIDGGVYDNSDVTIREALTDIVNDLKATPDHNGARGNIKENDELIPIDYDELMEKVCDANAYHRDSSDPETRHEQAMKILDDMFEGDETSES